ncbi:MAG: amino-acid N-acetyltransferase, partial [Methanohalophilus sp.]
YLLFIRTIHAIISEESNIHKQLPGIIRKAVIEDVTPMKDLINSYAKKEIMLPRSVGELYENIRNFYVYEENGEVIGCCALQVVWEDLAEILSFAVKPEHTGMGIGSILLDTSIEEGKNIGVKRAFTLTYVPEFFERQGFSKVEKASLPHKVWVGCIKCPKFPDCNEIALLRYL